MPQKKEKTNKARIEGVSLHLDVIKARKHKKGDLADTYFKHLPEHKRQAAADALWAMVGDKEVPEAAAETVSIEAPDIEEPATTRKKARNN